MTLDGAATTPDERPHRFHLVISTNRSPDHLSRCIDAVVATGADCFVTVVEQHPVPRCAAVVSGLVAAGRAEYVHDPVGRGISTGRNIGLRRIRGGIVAFPDDDCAYTPGVLVEVDRMLSEPNGPDGVAARLVTGDGRDTMLRWSRVPTTLTPALLPYTVSSSGLFFRAATVRQVGLFDTRLGTGAPTPFGSAEEYDFVVRAIAAGATIRYEPHLLVEHEDWRTGMERRDALAKALRYNRGFGRALRKHRLRGEMLRWTLRSVGGVVVRAAQLKPAEAVFQWTQLRGRVEGWSWGWDHQP